MLYIEYPKCTTCKRAKKYLDDHGISYTHRDIKEENPTAEELGVWYPKSKKADIKAFFNTSGQIYRGEGIKDKLPTMTDASYQWHVSETSYLGIRRYSACRI